MPLLKTFRNFLLNRGRDYARDIDIDHGDVFVRHPSREFRVEGLRPPVSGPYPGRPVFTPIGSTRDLVMKVYNRQGETVTTIEFDLWPYLPLDMLGSGECSFFRRDCDLPDNHYVAPLDLKLFSEDHARAVDPRSPFPILIHPHWREWNNLKGFLPDSLAERIDWCARSNEGGKMEDILWESGLRFEEGMVPSWGYILEWAIMSRMPDQSDHWGWSRYNDDNICKLMLVTAYRLRLNRPPDETTGLVQKVIAEILTLEPTKWRIPPL